MGPKESSYLGSRSQNDSISSKFSLPADPYTWGSPISELHRESDDGLHFPDAKYDAASFNVGLRGLSNMGCMLFLLAVLLGLLFVLGLNRRDVSLLMESSIGYPVASWFNMHEQSSFGGFNLGGINATGQV